MHEPPRDRSATSFCPAAASAVSGPASLRGAEGIGGDTNAVSELNLDVSRVGHPADRLHGLAEASPSIATGARCGACARVCRPTRVTIDATRSASMAPATNRHLRLVVVT